MSHACQGSVLAWILFPSAKETALPASRLERAVLFYPAGAQPARLQDDCLQRLDMAFVAYALGSERVILFQPLEIDVR